jgi:uncharacterized protein DUF4194
MVWLSGRKSQEAKEGRIGMDFLTDFGQFEPAQRERFQQVVTRLLQGDVLVPGPAMRPDPDWRFTERYRDLIDGYLRFGGWRLDIDLGLRLARAVHESGAQRVRFNKLESLLLCTLRLIYHEQMRQVSEEVLTASTQHWQLGLGLVLLLVVLWAPGGITGLAAGRAPR